MAKYVITFTKEGYIKYISHLDMMRLFKRAFKKSGLHLEHSKGFNPSPRLSLAQPLSLGYEGKAEMAEFETKEDVPPEEILKRLNEQMPPGITITSSRLKKGTEKRLAASCSAADYIIKIPYEEENPIGPEIAKDFMAMEKIPAMKRTKKNKEPVEVDIRPMIHRLQVERDDNKIIMYTKLDAGSKSNLSPELLLQAFFHFTGKTLHRETIEITRLRLYM